MRKQCMLDATEIAPFLYQGSRPPTGPEVRDCGFNVLVLSAAEYQPSSRMFTGVVVLRASLDDSIITKTQFKIALMTACYVVEEIRQSKSVLVTCNAGRNRSGLIVALSLLMLTGQSPRAIIHHIRNVRRGALTNPTFVEAIKSYGG